MSGTTVTLIGLVIAAIGGIIAFTGQRMSAREDSQKPNRQLEAIATDLRAAKAEIARVKSAPNADGTAQQQAAEAEERITSVENRLNDWADNLVKSSQSKKAEQKQTQLQSQAEALRISNEVRPTFQSLCNTINDAVTAYNHKTNSRIQIDLPPLPTDLFSEEARKYEGKVGFSDTAVWKIGLSASRPPAKTSRLYLSIYFTEGLSKYGSLSDGMTVSTDGSAEKWSVRGEGDHFGDIPERFSIAGAEIGKLAEETILKKLEQRLLELQP